jgi:predicted DsbA family dithiol-disulfide isomerase
MNGTHSKETGFWDRFQARYLEEVGVEHVEKPVLLATVFSDYICPFCYVGDVRLDRLREDYALRVNWCFVEIHPETPAQGMDTDRLGYPPPQWRRMMDNLDDLAREEGIVFCPRQFTTNSRKALLLAEEEGADIFYRLHRRLFESFFTEGRNIGEEAVLRDLADETGVSDRTVEHAWTDECYAQRLELYLAAAQQLRVRATPTIFFGERQRLDGALPWSAFQQAARAGLAAQQSG